MTREAREPTTFGWQHYYDNKLLSGIELCDSNGKLVNFINIRHDEILKNKAPHRIQIKLNENAEPILPPPKTFDQLIQAKRRQQMLLYGSGPSSLSVPSTSRSHQASSSTSHKKASRSSKPPSAVASTSSQSIITPSRASHSASNGKASKSIDSASGTSSSSVTPTSSAHQASSPASSKKSPRPPEPPKAAVKNKEIKAMLKSTPPGHSIILPDGTVIKKSRRGGARPGAGRKRSRPLPGLQ